MSNSPPGADFDSRAPWFSYREPVEIEYEKEEELEEFNLTEEEPDNEHLQQPNND